MTGEALTRDLIQAAQVAAPDAVPEVMAVQAMMKRLDITIRPYVEEGRVPPPGVDPIIDDLHREQAKTDLDALNEALKGATKTSTRERAPDLLKLYTELHGVTGEIGVSADAVRALYGDKAPTPDDGLLGWVPRIQEQLSAAEATGGDVRIPTRDWLAQVEPDVAKQLNDFIRVRPEGMTLEEAKQPIPDRPAETPLDTVREAAALNEVPRRERAVQLELPVEGTTRMEDRPAFEGAAPGLTKAQTSRYQRLIDKRVEEDQAYLAAKLKEAEARRQSKAWAERKIELRSQVVDELNARPEIALDEALREGKVKVKTGTVGDGIPKDWQDPEGYTPHDIVAAYGADVGLWDRVAAMHEAREASGMKPHTFRRMQIDTELERRLEAEFQKTSLDDITDHVLSQTQEEMLHEQTMALAEQAGQQYPVNADAIKAKLTDTLQQLPIDQIKRDRFLAEAGRAGRAMEDAHLKGDIAEAFRQSQRQQLAFLSARYAKDVEKAVADFDRLAKKYSKREVAGTLPEYTNAIHSILSRVGLRIGRTPEDLIREIEKGGYGSVKDFVEKKEAELAVVGTEVPVADFLLDDAFRKNVKDMSTWEYLGLRQSVKTLDYLGRMEQKVIREGEAWERKDWVKAAVEQLGEKFDARDLPVSKESLGKRFIKQTIAAFHSLETVFRRFDGRDPNGIFTETFVYPAAQALNDAERLAREVSREYKAVGRLKDPGKPVPHGFIDPVTERPFPAFTRENLEAVVANIGNKYNLDRMAYTLGMFSRDEAGKIIPDTEGLLRWVEANTTEADIARAQERGKIFSRLKAKSDTVYRNIYGVAPEDIKTQPFTMHGREWEGWYHPIIQDAERAIRDHQEVDAVTKPTSFWPSTPNSYTKRRTGAYERLSLNLGEVPLRLNQMVHDIGVRDFVNNTAKIVNDSEFRLGVTKYYGKEYHDMMKKWLYDIAGNASYNQSALSTGVQVSNFFRQNVISTYVAFNLGTVLKHAPTAAIMSAREMGSYGSALKFFANSAAVNGAHFGHWVQNFFGRDPALAQDAWEFAIQHSEELQRRDRNWMDTMSGAHNILYGRDSWRNRVMQWGAKAVALSDMASAVPLWYTKYHEVLAETGVHGDAVKQADLAVRNAHGSTSIASRPVIASEGGALAPWFTSLYGFFGANMQRKIELLHDINDTYHLAAEGELKKAASNIPGITASTMAYVVFPALVEEWVTGQFTDDKRGALQKAGGLALIALTNSIIGLRDFTWGFEHGQEPGAGLFSSTIHDFMAPVRDLKKPRPMSKQNAGQLMQDSLTAFGDATGMMPKPIARATRFGIDVYNGQQHPRGAAQWYRGVMSGRTQLRTEH